MKLFKYIPSLILLTFSHLAVAKVDLVTLPGRDTVQLTIYNSADLTLVRESRALTLKKGINKLQFSWANTLIDPTSLEMNPLAQAGQIDIFDLTFPPRVKNLGLWNIQSGLSGKVPVEITFLTSGISWRAFYMGTLTPDEKKMRLQGYVRVTNNSGEDYENAQTRLIVGNVHILDQIAQLANQQYPFGRPGAVPPPTLTDKDGRTVTLYVTNGAMLANEIKKMDYGFAEAPKEIKKEGLSEYFLYTIEGTETIPTGWSKRLPSFDVDEIPVESLYKYDEQRWGKQTIRYISFANDEDHELGETPIPNGNVKIYRNVDNQGLLGYVGGTNIKYIPVDEEVELNLGAARQVQVEPKLMDYRTENYRFDDKRNVSGWDEIRTWKITVKNTRELPIEVEITRGWNTTYWKLNVTDGQINYKKHDARRARFELKLDPRTIRDFTYQVRTYHGDRIEAYRQSNLSETEVLRLSDVYAKNIRNQYGFDLKFYPDRKPVFNESRKTWQVLYSRQPNRWPGDHFSIVLNDETKEMKYHGGK
jgi:hypothetical protein